MCKLIWLIGLLTILVAWCANPNWCYGQSSNLGQQLVPAVFQSKSDKLGFSWDVTSNGRIQYGTNRVFNGCGYLLVNGSGFSTSSSTHQQMTRDGSEYFLTRAMSGVSVTRRIKVDAGTSTVRYVEIFENSSSSPISLTITLGTSLRVPPQAVLTDRGKPVQLATPVGTPFIDGRETGILAYRQQSATTPYGVQPSVLFYLAGRGAEVLPSRNNSGNQQSFVFVYKLVVPAGRKAVILHGLAQRHFQSTPSSAELAKEFRVFQTSNWTRDLPPDIRKSIVNGRAFSNLAEQPDINVLEATLKLADAWSVERSQSDVLVFDDQTQIAGSLTGNRVTVETEYGEATIPIAEVAAIVGAGGVGRPSRVHLRSGEILVGPLRFEALQFSSNADLRFDLQPEQLNVLFTRVEAKNDPPKPPDAIALLKTRRGNRVAVSNLSELELSLVTAFGPHQVQLADVRSAIVAKSPQPVYQFVLTDGSRLSAMVRFSKLSVETHRFATQQIDSSMIASFVQVEDMASEQSAEPTAIFKLAGSNVLVGKPVAAEMTVATAAGETPVQSRQIRSMTREGEAESVSPVFAFEMADGSKFKGRLLESLIAIESLQRKWQIPVAHVDSFTQPDLHAELVRQLVEEFEAMEVSIIAQRLKKLAEDNEISLAAQTLAELEEGKSRLVLAAALKLDTEFGKELADSVQRRAAAEATEKVESEVEEKQPDQPPLNPASRGASRSFDPFAQGGTDPFGTSGGDPFGGNDPFGAP